MKAIKPAKRTLGIKYAIRDLVNYAESLKKEILYLNIGDPLVKGYGFSTPKHMIDAVKMAMDSGYNGYGPSLGLEDAREAIKREAVEKKGFRTVRNVIVTYGASEAVEFGLTALLNEGENVLTPSPGYPLYTAIISKLGARLNEYYLDESNGWQPDPDDIRKRINKKTRGIVLINPNNPTGSVAERDTLQEIIDIAREHNLVIFCDEIYDKMVFEGENIPLASLDDELPIVTFNGLSKNYLVPGWRVGWLIMSGRPELVSEYDEAIQKLARARLSINYPVQFAIKAALEGPQEHLKETVRMLRERRDYVVRRCSEIDGISLVEPKAAFYAYPKITDKMVTDDERFVKELVAEESVLFVHGSGFGSRQENHFRIVYLPRVAVLEKAFDRLERFMKNL